MCVFVVKSHIYSLKMHIYMCMYVRVVVYQCRQAITLVRVKPSIDLNYSVYKHAIFTMKYDNNVIISIIIHYVDARPIRMCIYLK